MPEGIESCRNSSVREKTRIENVGSTGVGRAGGGDDGELVPHATIINNPAIALSAFNDAIYRSVIEVSS